MTATKTARKTSTSAKTSVAKRKPAAAAAKARAATGQIEAAPAQPVVAAKPKQKLVRDSFTIPKAEYAVLEGLKVRAANLKRPTKKSELLRAGVVALQAMSDKAFLSVLNGVPSLKTGRPKGSHAADKRAKSGDA